MQNQNCILVTGGAGFIGSNFTRFAVEEFKEVYVLDKLTYAGDKARLADIEDEIQFIHGELGDRDVLGELYEKVDKVVNFAAHSHVDRSIENGEAFVRNNVEGTFTALDVLRNHDIDIFLQMSTDEVYGSIQTGEFTEGSQLNPSSPYSASKASADLFANAFQTTYGLPISIVRPTNVYGPRQHPEKLIPKFVLRALHGERLPVYGDGSNVRQWLFVDDLCEALLAILAAEKTDIFHIGGSAMKSNLEVTEMILDFVDASNELIEFVKDRKGHDFRYALDDTKLRATFKDLSETPFEIGLEETVQWYEENERWLVDRYGDEIRSE
jgi:dTDP-glucose 4,6-dehydratase